MNEANEKPSLEQKLERSAAVASLRLEQKTHQAVAATGWEAKHGVYYHDLETGKLREADVVGERSWHLRKKKLRAQEPHYHVALAFECKSGNKTHVVASPSRGYSAMPDSAWLGDEAGLDEVLSLLEPYKIAGNRVSQIKEQLVKIAYPNETSNHHLVAAPRVIDHFSSFRETTSSDDRKPEETVLWKGMMEVRALAASITRGWRAEVLRDMAQELDALTRAGEDADELLISSFQHWVRFVRFVHPIVVLENQFWIVDGQSLKRVTKARFQMNEPLGQTTDWWCDIVTLEALEGFVTETTSHYEEEFQELKYIAAE